MRNNLLSLTHPHLYAQLHPTRNAEEGIRTDDLTSGMHRKVWWQCEQKHTWQAVVYSRQDRGCPYCSGRKPVPGLNDFETLFPMIASELHPSKNCDLIPSLLSPKSNQKLWWICEHGHEWKTSVNHRTGRNTGCPVCTNRIVVPGFNDLASVKPDLAKQWHPSLNGELTPQMVTVGANRKAWWVCDEGHEFQSFINGLNAGKGCRVCFGQELLQGFNDLKTRFPQISAQWHPVKNTSLTPDTVLSGSHKSAWWQCKDGHEWKTTISSRTHGNKGCKFCDGQVAVPGVTDLETLNPAVAAEWNHDKNGDLLPSMVTAGSNQKVWWVCEDGHEWATTVSSRKRGSRCRICVGAGTSKTQMLWYETLLVHLPDLQHDELVPVGWKTHQSMLIDMISFENNMIIEYDGWYYHSGNRSGRTLEWHLQHDGMKTLALLDAGYRVVRIREGDLPHLDITHERLYEVSCKKNGAVDDVVDMIIDFIFKSINYQIGEIK